MSARDDRWGAFQRSAVLAVLAHAGCEDGTDLPPVAYETGRTVVGLDFDHYLCGGDLRFLDERITGLEQAMGVVVDEPARVFIYHDDPPPCEHARGCLWDNRTVLAVWPAVDHELVHLVSERIGRPADFWNEGLAEALRDRPTRLGPTDVLSSVDLPGRQLHYHTAGHFVRWLIAQRGLAPLLEVFRGASFAASFSTELPETVAEFEQGAPWSYPSYFGLQYQELEPDEGGGWSEVVQIRCDSQDATAFAGNGASVYRQFVVETDGVFELEITGGEGVRLLYRQLEEIEESRDEDYVGEIPHENSGLSLGRFYGPGLHTLPLSAGTYRLTATTDGALDGTVSVAIRPV